MEPKNRQNLERVHALLPLTEEAVDDFLDLIEELVDTGDPSVIGPILLVLDDHSEIGGVEETVVNLLEDFDSEVFIREFLRVLEGFYTKSPQWCESELKKILWSKEGDLLVKAVSTLQVETRRRLVLMLREIKAQTSNLEEACDQVLTKLDDV